jgi:hypothetical protein
MGMPKRTSRTTGSELFIVDNSDDEWKVLRYLHDWCQLSRGIDVATCYFEIGSLLALKDEWQKVDQIRVLMGDEVSRRTKAAIEQALTRITSRLDSSLEAEKQSNDFLAGVPAIVQAIQAGKIQCRVFRKEKFHAKAYITHARMEVVGSSALVGSSNFTAPGLTENIELNVQITGAPVSVLQEWYEEHWARAEDITPDILRTIERHTREYTPFEVYAKSLQEFFRGHEMTASEWELGRERSPRTDLRHACSRYDRWRLGNALAQGTAHPRQYGDRPGVQRDKRSCPLAASRPARVRVVQMGDLQPVEIPGRSCPQVREGNQHLGSNHARRGVPLRGSGDHAEPA